MPKPMMLAGLLGAAVGVPYVIDQAPQGFTQFAAPPAAPSESGIAEMPTFKPLPDVESLGPDSPIYRHGAPLAGTPTYTLAEVLRMDVTKEWVYGRWARKSTGLADPELFGVRVPLVTGTKMTDVAGSLSYYFDQGGNVQRIALQGTTADTTQLLQLLTSQYGFRPAAYMPPGEQWLEVAGKNGIESYIQTKPESVLWGNQPHQSFAVDMVLHRPGSGRVAKPPLPDFRALVPEPPPAPPAPPARAAAAPSATVGEATATPVAEGAIGGGSVELDPNFRGRIPMPRWPN